MSLFKCDWCNKDGFHCGRVPYAEIFPVEEDIEEENFCGIKGWKYKYPKFEGGWSYLCYRHFILAKLKGKHFAWCKVDSDRETLESIREELWDIQSDLYYIKEKLGIKTDYEGLDKLKELWDNPEDECWNEPDVKVHHKSTLKSKKSKKKKK